MNVSLIHSVYDEISNRIEASLKKKKEREKSQQEDSNKRYLCFIFTTRRNVCSRRTGRVYWISKPDSPKINASDFYKIRE